MKIKELEKKYPKKKLEEVLKKEIDNAISNLIVSTLQENFYQNRVAMNIDKIKSEQNLIIATRNRETFEEWLEFLEGELKEL